MRKIAVGLLACLALLRAQAAELQWYTDLPKAEAQARAQSKMVLLDFTGSDWCSWCIKFDREALSTPEFSDYAAKNLVLVKLDFPHKTPQSAELKRVNAALQGQYRVKGFPTFVVLDKSGKEIGRQVGYRAGGAKAFIARLEGFRK